MRWRKKDFKEKQAAFSDLKSRDAFPPPEYEKRTGKNGGIWILWKDRWVRWKKSAPFFAMMYAHNSKWRSRKLKRMRDYTKDPMTRLKRRINYKNSMVCQQKTRARVRAWRKNNPEKYKALVRRFDEKKREARALERLKKQIREKGLKREVSQAKCPRWGEKREPEAYRISSGL